MAEAAFDGALWLGEILLDELLPVTFSDPLGLSLLSFTCVRLWKRLEKKYVLPLSQMVEFAVAIDAPDLVDELLKWPEAGFDHDVTTCLEIAVQKGAFNLLPRLHSDFVVL